MLVVDDREKTQHPTLLNDIGLPSIVVRRLEAADYSFLDRNNNPVGIERSEIGNLIQKMQSGELESQLLKCQENYIDVILLIEGVYDKIGGLLAVYKKSERGYFRFHIHPNTQYNSVKALEIRLSELGIELIHSSNFECSMGLINVIYRQRTKPEESHLLFKKTKVVKIPTRWTNDPAVPKLMALVPRLPETVAKRLLIEYGSIWGVLHADDSEILQIGGFGRGALDKLKEGIGKPL